MKTKDFAVEHDDPTLDIDALVRQGGKTGVRDAAAAGADLYWYNHGEVRFVPNDVLCEALRVSNEHAAMHEARGVNEFDPVVLNWEDAVRVEPLTP